MKPLLINTSDVGGAARSCLRLHSGLLQQNVHSNLLLKNKSLLIEPSAHRISLQTVERSLKQKVTGRIIEALKALNLYSAKPDKFMSARPKGLEMFSYPNSDYRIEKSDLYEKSDIINLHWVANFLDYPSFFKSVDKPIVWTLHDENPFTGGEHYKETILGIDKNGYPINRLLSEYERLKFDKIIDIKREALSNTSNLTIVSPSKWLADEAKKSSVFANFDVKHIPYGLESNIYKPRDKVYSRELLDIPMNKKVLLFVSQSVDNKRKGFEFLSRAIESIKHDDVVLLSVGQKYSQFANSMKIRNLGYIHDELLMSIIYSAADVFILPSLMDNLPNTVLESLMCGTPVIAFPVGGIIDMVKNGENGYLTDDISVNSLKYKILQFLETSNPFVSPSISADALQKYELSVQAQSYISLFKSLLKE